MYHVTLFLEFFFVRGVTGLGTNADEMKYLAFKSLTLQRAPPGSRSLILNP